MRRGVASVLLSAGVLPFATAALALPGDLDPTFGSDGPVTTDFASTNDEAIGLTSQCGGKLIAAGQTDDLTNAGTFDFGLARYNADGSLDSSFGNSGVVRTSLSSTDSAAALAVLKLPSLDFVAVGYSGSDFAFARYQKDGSLDTSFDATGR